MLAAIAQSNSQAISAPRTLELWIEPAAALAGTALVATWLVLTSLHAGPLWRDETNSINVAQMPSLREFWDSMQFDSFPALWLLLLRCWSFLGLANSDAGIRKIGRAHV